MPNVDNEEEVKLLQSEIWTTLFRGGYMTGKLQRSLSGHHVSHACCYTTIILSEHWNCYPHCHVLKLSAKSLLWTDCLLFFHRQQQVHQLRVLLTLSCMVLSVVITAPWKNSLKGTLPRHRDHFLFTRVTSQVTYFATFVIKRSMFEGFVIWNIKPVFLHVNPS